MTSFPPNRYVQITCSILTILRLDVPSFFFSPPTSFDPYYVRELHSLLPADSSPSPPKHTHFLLPLAILGLLKIQVPVTFAYSPRPSLPPYHQCNEHVLPTKYSPPQCARRLLLSSAAPHHTLRLHHGNRAISGSYIARRHIGPTNVHSIPSCDYTEHCSS